MKRLFGRKYERESRGLLICCVEVMVTEWNGGLDKPITYM